MTFISASPPPRHRARQKLGSEETSAQRENPELGRTHSSSADRHGNSSLRLLQALGLSWVLLPALCPLVSGEQCPEPRNRKPQVQLKQWFPPRLHRDTRSKIKGLQKKTVGGRESVSPGPSPVPAPRCPYSKMGIILLPGRTAGDTEQKVLSSVQQELG